MGTDLTSVIGSLDFRVLVEFDEEYNIWVARCIDTDAVATADTPEEAEDLIKQVLENDIRSAVSEGSIKSLMHRRAAFDVVARWHDLKQQSPSNIRPFTLEVLDSPIPKRSVQPEIKFISRRKDGTRA